MRQTVASGQFLFRRGDPSGDLFVIEEGEVAIVLAEGDQQVELARMRAGEVLGIPTYLTGEPRMADAVACGAVVVRQISAESLKKTQSSLPDWIKIVLKEFTLRLRSVNSAYLETAASRERESASAWLQAPSPLWQCRQLVGLWKSRIPHLSESIDGSQGVRPERLVQDSAQALSLSEEEVQRYVKVWLGSGMLRQTMDREKKQPYFAATQFEHGDSFLAFCDSLRLGKTRRVLQQLTRRELKALGAVVRFAQDQPGGAVERDSFEQLQEEVRQHGGVTLRRDDLQAPCEGYGIRFGRKIQIDLAPLRDFVIHASVIMLLQQEGLSPEVAGG